jgi:aminoglycoside phosphotransferase (APT) family kinase protein
MPSTPSDGLDLAEVSAWVAGAAGMRGPVELTRVGYGQSNLTFLATDARGDRVIVRRPPLGELARGAHDMHREYRVLSALAAQPVPTPRPLAISEDGSGAGAPVYAMEHVEGIVLHTNVTALSLSEPQRRHASFSAVTALAALHAVDIEQAGLTDLGRHDGYAERQLRGWGRQWDATRTRDLAIIEETAAALSRSVPPQREVTIAHGDYNLANLIVGDDGEVRAILDWELCTLGDPVADLGTLLCYWPDGPDDVRAEREPVPLLPGFPRRAALVEAYAQAAPDRDLSGLRFWHALATWKLAIILEGVTRRRMENAANSRSSVEELRAGTDQLAASAAALAFG